MSGRSHTPDVEDGGEGPFVSFTDLLTGLLFLFLIMIALLLLQQRHGTGDPPAASGEHRAEAAPLLAQAQGQVAALTAQLSELRRTAGQTEQRLRGEAQGERQRADAATRAAGEHQSRAGELERRSGAAEREGREVAGRLATAERARDRTAHELEQVRQSAEQDRIAFQGQLAAMQQQLGDMSRRLTEAQRAPAGAGNLPIVRFSNNDRQLFGVDNATLTTVGRSELMARVSEMARLAEQRLPNQITIVGMTSPTPRPGSRALANPSDARDSNLDLSAQRALAIAHFFHSIGIPYRCMVVHGNGFSGTALPPAEDARLPRMRADEMARIEERYANERVVEVYFSQTRSGCSAASLAESLREAAARPRQPATVVQPPRVQLQREPRSPSTDAPPMIPSNKPPPASPWPGQPGPGQSRDDVLRDWRQPR